MLAIIDAVPATPPRSHAAMPIRRTASLLLPLLLATACAHSPIDSAGSDARHWADAGQMVLVTTADWDSTSGELRRYERDGDAWKQVGDASGIVVGRTGIAWGAGLNAQHGEGPVKREGDGKAPAGVFAIGPAFGYADSAQTGLEYRAMGANDWCIDVPASAYYNRIIDRSLVKAPLLDQSSEPMRRDIHENGDQRYRKGFVIEHNAANVPNVGSCIFAHLWTGPGSTTAGCTAMAPASMDALLAWLDARRKPVFVQLPQAQYLQLRTAWKLPQVDPAESAR
jgi:L,D-peptidoglycan transpeptidase YkuD (ErfK/YbiS/YcfS/YnhG family)